VEVAADDKWPADLGQFQVVVLANIEQFGEAHVRAIEQYVYGGGGLLIAPGGLSRIENYNEQLWRDGSGILPAELEDATPVDASEPTSIVGYDNSSPVFSFLRERPDLMLYPTIGRCFLTTPRSAEARALAWYTTGAPFLVESSGGRGRVLLMTTSLDADWSTLPLSSFYLPFVQSAVRYLAAGTLPSHNLAPGEPVRMTVNGAVGDGPTVITPEAETLPAEIIPYGQTTELRFIHTDEPGIYRIHFSDPSGERSVYFSVHRPAEGSNLTRMTDQRWSQLESDLHIKRIDPQDKPIAAVVGADREGYDLAPWALVVAVFAGVMELALAKSVGGP
jgi:hypothetical protein